MYYNAADKNNTLTLTVANPARILNSIAQRYQNAPRILMEYIDNAIDDAENLYRNVCKRNNLPTLFNND